MHTHHRSISAAVAALAAALFAFALPSSAQPSSGLRAALSDPGGRSVGQATATGTPNGVTLVIEVEGLSPGQHGFHVHEGSECAPAPDKATGGVVPFGAAGPHFDPLRSGRHGRPEQSAKEAHAGDLPNLEVGADGRGQLTFSTGKLTVSEGQQSLRGRTLVIHEKQDDHATNPSGNSGGRIACGIFKPQG